MFAFTYMSAVASELNEVVHITKESARRILSDVRELLTCPLHDNGIYYVHDEDDILTGYAMLYGQSGTVYEGGYYFFKIKFPADYPHSPLVVTFMTNDGKTRMHPNFYKNGYVCLSVLGNWKGDQWSGCMTLKSVLMISRYCMNPACAKPTTIFCRTIAALNIRRSSLRRVSY